MTMTVILMTVMMVVTFKMKAETVKRSVTTPPTTHKNNTKAVNGANEKHTDTEHIHTHTHIHREHLQHRGLPSIVIVNGRMYQQVGQYVLHQLGGHGLLASVLDRGRYQRHVHTLYVVVARFEQRQVC